MKLIESANQQTSAEIAYSPVCICLSLFKEEYEVIEDL